MFAWLYEIGSAEPVLQNEWSCRKHYTYSGTIFTDIPITHIYSI